MKKKKALGIPRRGEDLCTLNKETNPNNTTKPNNFRYYNGPTIKSMFENYEERKEFKYLYDKAHAMQKSMH